MTKTSKINYDRSKTAKYEQLKTKAYTEKRTDGTSVFIDSMDAKSKVYSEDDENIFMVQFNLSKKTATIWEADKKTKQYIEITDVPLDSGSSGSGSSSKSVLTGAWSGYYKIGSSDYPAEGFLYTYTTKNGTVEYKSAEIYCYNGKSWPDYVVSLSEQPVYDNNGGISYVMKEDDREKITEFRTSADADLMDFDKVLKGYKCKLKASYEEIKDLGGSQAASYALEAVSEMVH